MRPSKWLVFIRPSLAGFDRPLTGIDRPRDLGGHRSSDNHSRNDPIHRCERGQFSPALLPAQIGTVNRDYDLSLYTISEGRKQISGHQK
jgi:hypothetical protein